MTNRKLIDRALNFLAKPVVTNIPFTQTGISPNAFYTLEKIELVRTGFVGQLRVVLKSNSTVELTTGTSRVTANFNTPIPVQVPCTGCGFLQDHTMLGSCNANSLSVVAHHGTYQVVPNFTFLVALPLVLVK